MKSILFKISRLSACYEICSNLHGSSPKHWIHRPSFPISQSSSSFFYTFFLLHRSMHRALNERSYWFIEMKIRSRLQASAFSFIALNLVEKAVLHIFLIMVNTTLGELCIESSTKQATDITSPVDTGLKLNVHKTFRRRPSRLLNILICVQFTSCVYGVQRRALLRKISKTLKGSIFSFTIANLVNKRILYFSLLQVRY